MREWIVELQGKDSITRAVQYADTEHDAKVTACAAIDKYDWVDHCAIAMTHGKRISQAPKGTPVEVFY